MSGNDVYNTPMFRLTGRRAVPGHLGIEIEVEGTKTGANPIHTWNKNGINVANDPIVYWHAKPDNSLRNGLEYVTNRAIKIEDLPKVMDQWETLTKGTRFREDSIRTSVHYHVNVSPMSPNQILTAILGWWLLETPIVDLQGPTRVGNLFCLRVSDAEHIVNALLDNLSYDNRPLVGYNLGDNVKYAALNLNTIRRFGSLEFRFNRGTTDREEIERWGRFFHRLVNRLADMGTPKALIEFFEANGPDGLVDRFLPGWLRERVTRIDNWRDKINSNYSYAYMVYARLRDNEEVLPSRLVHYPVIIRNPDVDEFPWDHADSFIDYSVDEEDTPACRFKPIERRRGFNFADVINPDAPQMPDAPDIPDEFLDIDEIHEALEDLDD